MVGGREAKVLFGFWFLFLKIILREHFSKTQKTILKIVLVFCVFHNKRKKKEKKKKREPNVFLFVFLVLLLLEIKKQFSKTIIKEP